MNSISWFGRPRMKAEPTERENAISRQIVHCALTVHRTLGPGLLESVYETCLAHELSKEGLRVSRQVRVPIHYEEIVLRDSLRLDLLVENSVIVEVKAVLEMHPVFVAQLITYLKLGNKRLGLLLNFHAILLKDGMKRVVNGDAVFE